MKITLMSFTPHPMHIVHAAYQMSKLVVPISSVDDITVEDAEATVRSIVKDSLSVPLEFVNMVWLLEGVSRAFQQQLTRHRTAAYSIQSMRVVDAGDFADEARYHIPLDCKHPVMLMRNMKSVQEMYSGMIKSGEPVQVARGILPLNIHSPIMMNINMKAFLHLVGQRMCDMVQGEFREVAREMVRLVKEKMAAAFVSNIGAPCDTSGNCQMSAENEIKIATGVSPCARYYRTRKETI